MYRQTRWVVTGLLYMWICESHAARAENRQEQMTLVVCDRVHLDPLVLDTARDGVTRIFDNAGIDLTWLSTCTMPAKPSYLVVVVARRAPKSWTSSDAMGFAPVRTGPIRRAYIFHDRVNEMVGTFIPSSFRVSGTGVILGGAIAHELAHLLTGGDNHTQTGIMSGRWGYSQWREAVMGRLLFTSDQARLIQKELLMLQRKYAN